MMLSEHPGRSLPGPHGGSPEEYFPFCTLESSTLPRAQVLPLEHQSLLLPPQDTLLRITAGILDLVRWWFSPLDAMKFTWGLSKYRCAQLAPEIWIGPGLYVVGFRLFQKLLR